MRNVMVGLVAFCLFGFGLVVSASPSAGVQSICTTATAGSAASVAECDALRSLYQATNGPGWTFNTGWNTATDPCNWHGVTCDGRGVVGVSLYGNGLSGQIPAAIGNVIGTATQEPVTAIQGPTQYICPAGFTSSGSGLATTCTKTSAPAMLCPVGTTLASTGVCKVDGSPGRNVVSAADCTASEAFAVVLGVSRCFPIQPMSLVCSVGSLVGSSCVETVANVTVTPTPIWACPVGATGTPFPGGTCTRSGVALRYLSELNISNNDLTGTIPSSLGNITSLAVLILAENDLTGSIPSSLGDLANLLQLNLSDNGLSGSIPAQLGDLVGPSTHVTGGSVVQGPTTYTCPAGFNSAGSGPSTTCSRATAPAVVCPAGTTAAPNGQCKVDGSPGRNVSSAADCTATEAFATVLGVSKCFPVQPKILVCSVGLLVGSSCVETVANIPNNPNPTFPCPVGTTGDPIAGATCIGSGLVVLALSSNALTGAIPADLGDLSALRIFNLHDNALSGQVPTSITNLSDLQFLSLYDNGCLYATPATNTWLAGFGAQVGTACQIPLCDGMPVTHIAVPGLLTLGSPGNDVILGTPGRDVIRGGDGDDLICGLGGNDVILGEDGKDQIFGGNGNDTIWGGIGDDLIRGGAGIDRIRGGDGVDTIHGDADRDVILGEAGADVIFGGSGRDSLYGGDGGDLIDGGQDTDLIRGQGGDDWLEAGSSGNDRLVGGTGDDILDARATTGSTRMLGEDGDDIFYGSNQLDRMWGHAGADTMYGRGYNDLLRGGSGNDIMYGESGRDTLDGGTGNDYLHGGAGNGDKLVGMSGTDTCDGGSGIADSAHSTCEDISGVS